MTPEVFKCLAFIILSIWVACFVCVIKTHNAQVDLYNMKKDIKEIKDTLKEINKQLMI